MIVKFLKIKNNKKLASKKQPLNRNGLWNDIFKVPTQNSIPRTFFKMMSRKRHFYKNTERMCCSRPTIKKILKRTLWLGKKTIQMEPQKYVKERRAPEKINMWVYVMNIWCIK